MRVTNSAVWIAKIVGMSVAATASFSHATNPEFQDFFFDACVNPTGTLAARCGETNGGLGDLSGDSESSLNPSQVLSNGDVGLASARSRSKEARERTERLRGGQPDSAAEPAAVEIGPFSLLINGRGRFDEVDREVDVDEERGYESDALGLELGFDYRVNERVVVGGLVTWEDSEIEFDAENPGVNFTPVGDSAGEINSEGLGVTLFGSINLSDAAYLEGSVGYVWSEHNFTRNSVFQESNRVVPQTNSLVEAEADGDDFWVAVNGGYVLERGGWSVTPYLGAVYSRSKVDGYSETDVSGSGLALDVDSVKRTSFLGHVGIRLSGGISTRSAVWLPHVRLEYEHEFDGDADSSEVALQLDANGNVFSFEGDDPDRDVFNVGAGLAAIFPNGWIPFVDVQVLLGHRDRDSYRITVGLRKEL